MVGQASPVFTRAGLPVIISNRRAGPPVSVIPMEMGIYLLLSLRRTGVSPVSEQRKTINDKRKTKNHFYESR